VNVGDSDLARVAAAVERVTGEFPLRYALDRLPPGKKELASDEEFREALRGYLSEDRDLDHQRAHGVQIAQRWGGDPAELKLPPGFRFTVRGEVSSMRDSFSEMTFNLLLAVVLLYLLMAAQFASWRDPLIMIVAAPLGVIGVVFTLYLTGTSLNIQSFMGLLMMIGIAHSNSTLMVDFANPRRKDGMDT